MRTIRLLLPFSLLFLMAVRVSVIPFNSTPTALAANSVGCPPGPLECGPWPTLAHDNQRTNQTKYLLGPTTPTNIKVIYDAGSAILSNAVSVTSDGKILISGCVPQISNVDASADVNPSPWPYTLTGYPYPLASVGLTVSSDGHIYAAIHECPDVNGAVPVNYYSITKDGGNATGWPITGTSAMYFPPAL